MSKPTHEYKVIPAPSGRDPKALSVSMNHALESELTDGWQFDPATAHIVVNDGPPGQFSYTAGAERDNRHAVIRRRR